MYEYLVRWVLARMRLIAEKEGIYVEGRKEGSIGSERRKMERREDGTNVMIGDV